MNSLKKDFIERTIAALGNLSVRGAESETFSQEFLREILRTLHTIKGTSQTFGFSASSNLAHELEDLIANVKSHSELKPVLLEGFGLLIKSFRQIESANEQVNFRDKLNRISRVHPVKSDSSLLRFPFEISERLADVERKALASALSEGKEIFRVHAGFDMGNFAGEFKNLRESLSSQGEIIATHPSAQTREKNKIGFVIYFAADNAEKRSEVPQNGSAEIDWQIVTFEGDLEIVFSEIQAYAEKLARESDKEISVQISADKVWLSRERSNLIFDALMHLVRNAIDHGIETPEERIDKDKSPNGTIEMILKTDENGLFLSVQDDGNGVDLKKLRTRAIEKNLVLGEKHLTENELLDLIFLHDFSTAETVTETSGRGVGLDAVKTMVENASGTIGVKSVKDSGTTFEIFLPNEI
jgi:two-component system chemotaxis sensor kinase CheA